MDIRIGIAHTPRELSFETNQTAAEVQKIVEDAMANGTKTITLSDNKGKIYLVPTTGLGYLEIGSDESRRIGFVA